MREIVTVEKEEISYSGKKSVKKWKKLGCKYE